MSAVRDTIAAVATPAGAGGVGVVRVSGPLVPTIARTFLGRAPRSRYAHFTAFCDADGRVLDRGLLLYFPAPRSFTGEDVLELQAHGSPVVLALLLRRVCALGARPAHAGEFSERAFLEGKLDLAQAEAVADLVASHSEAAARAALRSLDGTFSRRVAEVQARLVRLRVWIEAAIDFPEEEIDFLATPELARDLADLRDDFVRLLTETRRGVRLCDGLHVVIVGRPNAGKSSLLNALAGNERAIVADLPGTTRDVLRETIVLDGIALTLADTAGLRDGGDAIECEGMRRARAELERADVAVLVADTIEPPNFGLLDPPVSGQVRLVVRNKIDLADVDPARRETPQGVEIALSAKTGAGLDLLREELKRFAGLGEGSDGAFSARGRHVLALERAEANLDAAQVRLHDGAGELAAEELRRVQQHLGELIGDYTNDDLLGEIFASFCIGK